MAENRIEQRLRSRGNFLIFTEGAGSVDAKVLDVSPSGIGVETAIPFEHGTVVRLDCYGVSAEGTVRQCRVSGDRFVVGIALSPPGEPELG